MVPRDSCFAVCCAGGGVTQVRRAAGDEDLVSPVGEGRGRGAARVTGQGDGRSPKVGTEQGRKECGESESFHTGECTPTVWERSTPGAWGRDPSDPERDPGRKGTRRDGIRGIIRDIIRDIRFEKWHLSDDIAPARADAALRPPPPTRKGTRRHRTTNVVTQTRYRARGTSHVVRGHFTFSERALVRGDLTPSERAFVAFVVRSSWYVVRGVSLCLVLSRVVSFSLCYVVSRGVCLGRWGSLTIK